MCRPVFIGVLLSGSLTFAAGAAKPKPDQARKYLDAAVRLYNAFEFERALEQLGKARASAAGPELDVTIALYEGMLQLELGRDEQAETAFKSALALEPNASLPTRVSPKVQQLFDRLKTEMSKPPPALEPKKEELKPAPAVTAEPLVPPPAPVVQQRRSSGPPGWWWAPAAGGAAVAVVGTIMLFQAKGRSDQLSGRSMADFDLATAERYRSEGKTFQALGFAGLGLGLACIALSAVVFFLLRGS